MEGNKLNSIKNEPKEKKSRIEKITHAIEKVGNKLPHPFWLFTILIFVVIILSKIFSSMGVSVMATVLGPDGALVQQQVAVKNLMTAETFNKYMGSLTTTYVNFAPLGQLILMVMSVGFAEKVGFFSALMRKMVVGAPISTLVFILALVGVNSSIGFGAGVIFSMMIGAAMFKAIGMHPWIGIIIGYASANGGFTANFSVTSVDTMLSAITTQVVQTNGINAPSHPLINYYFIFASTIVITLATVFVAKKFLIPYLSDDSTQLKSDRTELDKHKITPEEVRGLKFAGVVTLIFFAILLIMTLPKGGILRNAEGGFIPNSPLLQQIVTILFFLFFAIGIAYGKGTGAIKRLSDIPDIMQGSLDAAITFMVVALPASVFVQLFSDSKMATIMAVNGAEMLKSMNISGMPLFFLVTLFTLFMNMFITSNSGKWVMFAPFLVPMLAMLNISPAMAQILYRIGDSSGNIISPVELNVPIALGLLESYKVRKTDKAGIGSLISLCLPFTVAFIIAFFILVAIFYYFNLPLGPGANIFIN